MKTKLLFNSESKKFVFSKYIQHPDKITLGSWEYFGNLNIFLLREGRKGGREE